MPKELLGDKIRLKQVLINLTKYALKHIHNGQITIKTSFNYQCNTLEVHKLLRALHNHEADVREDSSDDGLEVEFSLIACKKILGCSGGTLDFHSDGEGRGSTFVFSIKMDLPVSQSNHGALSSIVEEKKQSSSSALLNDSAVGIEEQSPVLRPSQKK